MSSNDTPGSDEEWDNFDQGYRDAMSSNTNNLREIYERCDVSNNGTVNPLSFEEFRDALLALLPEQSVYPETMEYVDMVKKASENGKYDDMYDNGFRAAIDQTRRKLIGEQLGDSDGLSDAQATLNQVDNLRPESAPEEEQ